MIRGSRRLKPAPIGLMSHNSDTVVILLTLNHVRVHAPHRGGPRRRSQQAAP